MESGNLILSHKPFNFHQALQHVTLAHRATAESTGLEFKIELDPCIDAIGGIVIGDDMRLKQVCSNLVSNAFKFTQTGSVRMVSKLLYPQIHAEPVVTARQTETVQSDKCPFGASAKVHASLNFSDTPPQQQVYTTVRERTDTAIIRIEIHDTGVGLSLSDVRDNRLFSPYVQTEIGRRQGGKGSGLGLALVTQIVKLSKGRLGVDSEPGKGSVFWFELPYDIPAGRTLPSTPSAHDRATDASPNHVDGFLCDGEVNTVTTQLGEVPSHSATPKTDLRTSPLVLEPGAPPEAPLPSRVNVLPSSPILAQANSPLNTLVVDDDPLTRRLMSRMLTRLGHLVQVAEDGQAAMTILERSWREGPGIDVVFLDK